VVLLVRYLRAPIRGTFYLLYMVMDVWSRKIVGSVVHEEESSALAAELIASCCSTEGVVPSFSRPSVSNDNPYSEALFRTAKCRPQYPRGCFASLDAARDWVARFVCWYNTQHLHSAIRFVTPEDRHNGQELAILAARKKVYDRARARKPERWTGEARNWNPVAEVTLNPDNERGRSVA
jgi:putative transposase